MRNRIAAAVLAAVTGMSAMLTPEGVISEGNAPYICLGEDLSKEERNTVLELLELDPEQLTEDTVVRLTEEDEQRYVSLADPALAENECYTSCRVSARELHEGLTVETVNLTGYTPEMYLNALATCGAADENIVIAAPMEMAGTDGVAAAAKACAKKNGHALDPDAVTIGTRELILQGQLAEDGADAARAAALIGLVKRIALEDKITDIDELRAVFDDVAAQIGIHADEENAKEAVSVVHAVVGLKPDVKTLLLMSEDIYGMAAEYEPDLTAYGIDLGDDESFFEKMRALFAESEGEVSEA